MKKPKGAPRAAARGSIRIIGGKWRGRKLEVADVPGLRPTGDRVRETVFNWLAPHIEGARCLDLFAGTGALGFEALSRGAASCVFVESDKAAAGLLERQAQALHAENATIVQSTADNFLTSKNPQETTYDIVFLDPPFANNLHKTTIDQLLAAAVTHAQTLLYVESAAKNPLESHTGLDYCRQKRVGDVVFALANKKQMP